MKTSKVPGTVAAFFFYRNNTSEIDIESLSRFSDPYKTYFAIQPQIYDNGQASPLTHDKHNLQFDPTEVTYIIKSSCTFLTRRFAQDFHEYRFDWLPGSVKFYIDNIFVREMTTNIPDSPGRVLLNHWTDGNPLFSGGPPNQNSDLSISHLNLFFNSSESTAPPSCIKSKTPCQISGK
jgi:beta-glucanase (GH16 family)